MRDLKIGVIASTSQQSVMTASHQDILNLRTDEIVKCRFAKVLVDGATNFS